MTKLSLLRARTHFLSPPPSLSLSSLTPKPLLLLRRRSYCSSSSIKMSSSTPQIIEHIVLFKVKPDTDPSKIDSMVNNLSGLTSLDQVVHLTAGPLLRTRSSPFAFTHMLHCRYNSKEDLKIYADHPSHVGVVSGFVLPICDDVMAVDWVAGDYTGPVVPRPGSAMRVNLLKLKEGLGENEKAEVLSVIGGMKECFPSIIEHITFGENFSPGRAKGYSIGSIAILPGLSELEALDSDSDSEAVNLHKDKVRALIESVIVLDYVIPQQNSASLL